MAFTGELLELAHDVGLFEVLGGVGLESQAGRAGPSQPDAEASGVTTEMIGAAPATPPVMPPRPNTSDQEDPEPSYRIVIFTKFAKRLAGPPVSSATPPPVAVRDRPTFKSVSSVAAHLKLLK